MRELDEIWGNLINEAIAGANASGRSDVAEYLSLKASNDAVRSASVNWLIDSAAEIAGEINRRNPGITIEDANPHRFQSGSATLVGSLIRFRQGVRCLSIEAGWTRSPNDGFMRRAALAVARITHFGMSKQNSELILLRNDNAPSWFFIDNNEKRHLFDSRNLLNHFKIFLGAV